MTSVTEQFGRESHVFMGAVIDDRAFARVTGAIDRAKAATTWNEYEIQDDLFHRAVAEASDNLLLVAELGLIGSDFGFESDSGSARQK